MRVNFLDLRSQPNMDCMGSFGLGVDLGATPFPRLAGFVKARSVRLPDLQLAYLAAHHLAVGDEVLVTSHPIDADIHYIHTSISGYEQEIQVAKSIALSNDSEKIRFIGAMATAVPDLFSPWGVVIPGEPSGMFHKDFNEYPHPDWSIYDYKKFSYWPSLSVWPVVPMLTSMGCRFNCFYCPYASYYGAWRPRKIDSLKKELDYLVGLGIRGIVFRDPLFTGERNHTAEKVALLKTYKFKWACETRLEMIDFQMLAEMKEAGCSAVHFGIESANDDVLASVNRGPINKERAKKLLDYCELLGIRVNCFFILGFPEDTYDTIAETIDFAKHLNPNVAEFFIATPYPGTPLEKSVRVTTDWKEMTGYKLCYEHQHITQAGADMMREKAYSQFYRRPKLWLKNLKMLSPWPA